MKRQFGHSHAARVLLLFFPVALLIGLGVFALHVTEQQRLFAVHAEQGRETVSIWTEVIEFRLKMIRHDVLYLAEHFKNREIKPETESAQRARLAADWIAFLNIEKDYDQIRWFDTRGIELLSVYSRPTPLVSVRTQRDDSAVHAYAMPVNLMNPGEVFISPFDLDSAPGQPEEKYKSKICFGTPLFDRNGKRSGVALLNYSAAALQIDWLDQISATATNMAWLADRDGYLLKGPEAARQGNNQPERARLNLRQRYPQAWEKILLEKKGQFMTDEGMWTFDTVFPMRPAQEPPAAAQELGGGGIGNALAERTLWKTVSLQPAAEYRSSMLAIDTRLGASALVLLILFLYSSWTMARSQLVERAARRNLERLLEERNRDLADSRRLENALQASDLFARATIDALAVEICVLDADGAIVAVNQAWRQFYAANRGDCPDCQNCGVGANYLAVCARAIGPAAEQAAPLAAGIRAVIDGKRDIFKLEYPCHTPDQQRWYQVGVTRFQGASRQVVITHENITERKKAEAELRLSATVYKAIGEAILVTDAGNVIVAINPAFTQLTGYAEAEVVGQATRMLASGRNSRNFYRNMWHELEKTGHWQGKIWTRHKDGSEILGWLRINTIYDARGALQQRTGMYSTITDQKLAEQALWEQANFDALTGLPNRSMFYERLEQEIRKAHRAGLPLALMFLDLDHFKDVNDTLGHDMGDLLLKETALKLRRCVREVDTVARLGGDEFTVILGPLDDSNKVERVAHDILKTLAQPFQLGTETVYISASIGITLYPADAAELGALLKNADQAMYAAKSLGRNQFHYFTPSMQERAQHRMRLASDLRGALAARQFQVVYQPIVELASGAIYKAEALMRWQHPQRGMVTPDEFIPVAEETGIINEIGEWIFREAALQAGHWRSLYQCQFQISVNMSPAQFRKACSHCSQNNPNPYGSGEIVVEITEGLLLDASSAVTDQLLLFRDAGIQVSIDDFGTGYSSLSYLKKFHIDYLKIDRSFVLKLEAGSDDLALCEAIIVMAHKLGMKVIAEGIETARQRDLLAAAGCDFGQGYLFSKALPASDFEQFLKSGLKK